MTQSPDSTSANSMPASQTPLTGSVAGSPAGPAAADSPLIPRVASPTAQSMADRAAFATLVDASLTNTRATAEKWRTGLAALVTLVTTALLIKGPEAANDLTTGWLIALTCLLGMGLLLAVGGLWLALSAASGVPSLTTYDAVKSTYGSVKAFEVAEAGVAAKELAKARIAVIAALILLLAGMIVWWWAPKEDAGSPTLTVTTSSGTMCGTLVSADHGELRLTVTGDSVPRVVALDDILAMKAGTGCG